MISKFLKCLHIFLFIFIHAQGSLYFWMIITRSTGYLHNWSKIRIFKVFLQAYSHNVLNKIVCLPLDSDNQDTNSEMLFIGHAVKSEIAKIQSCYRLLVPHLNDTAAKTYGRIIDNSCGTLQKLLERTQSQLHEITIKYEPVGINQLIYEVLSGYAPLIAEKKITIHKEFFRETYFWSDKDHLYNVVDNLLRNAIEALPEKGGCIFVCTQLLQNELVISITDNGCGMNAEVIKQISKPFFTTKDTKDNYGLGMTYCYKVVKKMGGRIEIKSKLNQGSTISIFVAINTAWRK